MKTSKSKFISPYLIVIGFYILDLLFNQLFNKSNNEIINIFIILFLVFILFFIYRKEIIDNFKRFFKEEYKDTFKYIRYYLIGYTLMMFITALITFFVKGVSDNEALARQLVIERPIYSFILMCVIAPFYEEVLLRLNFKKIFNNKWTFSIFTGVFFGFLHVITASSLDQLLFIIPYSVMGITLGLIYYESNNISFSILVHFINNLFSYLVVLLVLK